MEEPRVLIVIPCKTIDAHTKECIKRCLEIEYSNYEIIVVPDYHKGKPVLNKQVRIISTGNIRPLRKRLVAASQSDAELCAFIDADAFPTKNWVKNAIRHFKDSDTAAVTGPSLTPEDSDAMARASGLVLASSFGGGSQSVRYSPHPHLRHVSETPACNLLIRKSVLETIRELLPNVWPGEEIVLCGMISKDLKKKIIYDPEVLVYHRRRPMYIPHLKQIWSYGVIKGILLKFYPKYVGMEFFIPSLFVLFLIGGLFLSMLNSIIGLLYITLTLAYVFLSLSTGIIVGLKERSIKLGFLVFTGIIATHICYGIGFIKGIFSREA